jgi:1-acyl-sn-glycerol-3-phosphate acyltransferase
VAARLLSVVLFQIRSRDRQRIPASGGALVCSNHQSFFDPVLVGLICDRRLNYLARENLFDQRLFGALIRWYDAIPIRRDGLGLAGLRETLKRLKRGELVLIFPEGTRTRTGSVQPLKPGFCVLARRARVPLVPVGIDGPFQLWPRGRKLPRLGPIALQVGDPIVPDQIARISDEELVGLLQQRLERCHRRARQQLRSQEGMWSDGRRVR